MDNTFDKTYNVSCFQLLPNNSFNYENCKILFCAFRKLTELKNRNHVRRRTHIIMEEVATILFFVNFKDLSTNRETLARGTWKSGGPRMRI